MRRYSWAISWPCRTFSNWREGTSYAILIFVKFYFKLRCYFCPAERWSSGKIFVIVLIAKNLELMGSFLWVNFFWAPSGSGLNLYLHNIVTVSGYQLSVYGRLCGPWILFCWNCHGKPLIPINRFSHSSFCQGIHISHTNHKLCNSFFHKKIMYNVNVRLVGFCWMIYLS